MPRRRRRSWGSITTISKNKHVIRWVENTPEGRKRKSRTIHGTYREASMELDRLHVLHADDRPCPTVGRAAELWWLPWVASDAVKPSTRDSYLRAWNNHVRPRWAGVPLDAVRPLEVQEWLSTLTKGNATMCMNVLRRIGDLAVRYEAVSVNKFRIQYDMPDASRKGRDDVLSLDQAEAMLAELRGTRIEAPFILSCFGGLRTGESLAVRVDEVRMEEVCGLPVAMVSVRRQMSASGCEPIERLKNEQSVRTALVAGDPALRLAKIRDGRIAEGVEWMADRGDGLPMSKSMLGGEWRSKHGAPVPWRNLRTSWRTFCAFVWHVDYDAAELLMGHRLQGVTGRHYLRPSDKELAECYAGAIAAYLG